jgi:hypothetical protein
MGLTEEIRYVVTFSVKSGIIGLIAGIIIKKLKFTWLIQ